MLDVPAKDAMNAWARKNKSRPTRNSVAPPHVLRGALRAALTCTGSGNALGGLVRASNAPTPLDPTTTRAPELRRSGELGVLILEVLCGRSSERVKGRVTTNFTLLRWRA